MIRYHFTAIALTLSLLSVVQNCAAAKAFTAVPNTFGWDGGLVLKNCPYIAIYATVETTDNSPVSGLRLALSNSFDPKQPHGGYHFALGSGDGTLTAWGFLGDNKWQAFQSIKQLPQQSRLFLKIVIRRTNDFIKLELCCYSKDVQGDLAKGIITQNPEQYCTSYGAIQTNCNVGGIYNWPYFAFMTEGKTLKFSNVTTAS